MGTSAYLSAIELAKRIRSRQLSVVELTETVLARIDASQPPPSSPSAALEH
jgi:Asp-tRNA(Asn)/Glu-tRNA(Gln) amidotransferase A subunit family amidase